MWKHLKKHWKGKEDALCSHPYSSSFFFFFFFFRFVASFQHRVSLCSSGCPGTQSVDFYWPFTPRDLPASDLLEPWDTPWGTLSMYPHFVWLSLSVCLNLRRGGGHPSQVVLDPKAEEGTCEGNSPFESL